MAVTSLWRVKGYIGKVILYTMNGRKTTENEIVETNHDDTDPGTALNDLLAYTERDNATNLKQYVYGIRCRKETAKDDMIMLYTYMRAPGRMGREARGEAWRTI